MAQKLHDQYGFDFNNIQVLLGGWSAWREQNAQDPEAYPIGTGGADTGGSTGSTGSTQPEVGVTVIVPEAAPTTAPNF